MFFNPPYSIVLIDDDPEIISILTLILNAKYPELFDIAAFSSFKKGIEKIKKDDVNIIFLDLNLLEEDGIEGIEEIKKLHKRAQLVAFSSDTKLSTILTCYDSGADFFMKKPINRDNLSEVVDDCIAPFSYWENLIQDITTNS